MSGQVHRPGIYFKEAVEVRVAIHEPKNILQIGVDLYVGSEVTRLIIGNEVVSFGTKDLLRCVEAGEGKALSRLSTDAPIHAVASQTNGDLYVLTFGNHKRQTFMSISKGDLDLLLNRARGLQT